MKDYMNEEEMRALARMSTGWHILSPFPVPLPQLEIIFSVVDSMRQGFMDYITVELQEFQGDIDFIQTATTEPGYRVELKLTDQQTRMFAVDLEDAEQVKALFFSVLYQGEMPDLAQWEDITEMVFYPQLNGEESEETTPPVQYENLQ